MFGHTDNSSNFALLIAGDNLAINAALGAFILYAHQDLGVSTEPPRLS
jgi:hypothetical protein